MSVDAGVPSDSGIGVPVRSESKVRSFIYALTQTYYPQRPQLYVAVRETMRDKSYQAERAPMGIVVE